MLERRQLITGLISLVTAPAIVRATSLMPVKAWESKFNWYFYLTDQKDHYSPLVGARASAWIQSPPGTPWRFVTAPIKEIGNGMYAAALTDEHLKNRALLRFSAAGGYDSLMLFESGRTPIQH